MLALSLFPTFCEIFASWLARYGFILASWLVFASAAFDTFKAKVDKVKKMLDTSLSDTPITDTDERDDNKLSPKHVQAVLNAMVDEGLAPRTAAYARAILRAALNVAIKYGYLVRNLAALVDVPKDDSLFEGQAMTVEQVQAFLGTVAGHRLEPLYRLTLALGLRRGESSIRGGIIST